MPEDSAGRYALQLSSSNQPASALIVAVDEEVAGDLRRMLADFARVRHITGGRQLDSEHPDVAILVLTGAESDLDVLLAGVVLAEHHAHTFRIALGPATDAALIMDAVNVGRCESYHALNANRVDLAAALARGLATARQRAKTPASVPDGVVGLQDTVINLEGLLAATKTQLAQARQRLRLSQNEIFELELQASISQLVRGLAHELNNPLSAILGHAQRLQQTDTATPGVAKRSQVIESEVERCIDLVRRLRALAIPPSEEPALLNIDSLVGIACQRLEERGIVYPAIIYQGALPELQVSRRSFSRILEVVLENATEAAASQVEVSGEIVHDRAVFHFDSDGDTPCDETIRLALRPFFTTRSQHGHHGLGLALASALVRDMAGSITLDRRPGRGGARITLTVPAAETYEPSPMRNPQLPGERKAVLVVDDEPLIAELIDDLLSDLGHESLLCGSLDEARRTLSEREIHAVLCDLRLPDGSGSDLVAEIAERFPHLQGRFVLVTGDTSDPAVTAVSQELGCPVIGKPFHLAEMQRVVESALA